MNDRLKIDLKKNLMPSISKKYLVKFSIYGVILLALLLFYWYRSNELIVSPIEEIEEINHIEFEPNSAY
jgi:hypothetical protein